jgi:hypothetical protein
MEKTSNYRTYWLKTSLLALFMVFSFSTIKAQHGNFYYFLDFDDPTQIAMFEINSSQPDNIWEIGPPLKPVFFNLQGLVTDVEYSYPVGNVSSVVFTFPFKDNSESPYTKIAMDLNYRIDTDSLMDYGVIEYSIDGGSTWYNLVKDTAELSCQWQSSSGEHSGSSLDSIVFTGTDIGWPWIHFEWTDYLSYNYNYPKLRFTFYSDSIETNQAGWIIYNIEFTVSVNVGSVGENRLINIPVYPNPTNDCVRLPKGIRAKQISVTDILGQQYAPEYSQDGTVCLQGLSTGVYFLRIEDEKGLIYISKLIKE